MLNTSQPPQLETPEIYSGSTNFESGSSPEEFPIPSEIDTSSEAAMFVNRLTPTPRRTETPSAQVEGSTDGRVVALRTSVAGTNLLPLRDSEIHEELSRAA